MKLNIHISLVFLYAYESSKKECKKLVSNSVKEAKVLFMENFKALLTDIKGLSNWTLIMQRVGNKIVPDLFSIRVVPGKICYMAKQN